MLRALECGCRVPVGAWGRVVDDGAGVRLLGVVASPDGSLLYRGEAVGAEPGEVGERLAGELLERGAAAILDEIREVRRA